MKTLATGSKRSQELRRRLSQRTVVAPGAFNTAVALLVEKLRFDAVYVSSAAVSAGLAGVPDIGLMTMDEVARQAEYNVSAVNLPIIVDADTGFGEAANVMRTVKKLERIGVSAIHIEDQVSPKRCGHLPGKEVITPDAMCEKIRAARAARSDKNFMIIARVDSRAVNGLGDAIARGRRYLDAGADMVFPEALESKEEFALFAKKVDGLLMANMTEFGKSPYLTVQEFSQLGYRLVIFPMTAFRVAMKAAEDALRNLKKEGTQKSLLPRMQTRNELYDLLDYASYEKIDRKLSLRPRSKTAGN